MKCVKNESFGSVPPLRNPAVLPIGFTIAFCYPESSGLAWFGVI